MIQLKLNLNSDKPSTVYSLNGKSYRLVPGTNVLNLEYEDYVSLAKALSIVPVERPSEKKFEDNQIKQPEPTHEESRAEEPKQESPTEEPTVEECVEEPVEEPVEQAEEQHVEEHAVEESVEESNESEIVDYSTWSYTKLKAEYKHITGNTCKLKKEDIIAFLRENNSNV